MRQRRRSEEVKLHQGHRANFPGGTEQVGEVGGLLQEGWVREVLPSP